MQINFPGANELKGEMIQTQTMEYFLLHLSRNVLFHFYGCICDPDSSALVFEPKHYICYPMLTHCAQIMK